MPLFVIYRSCDAGKRQNQATRLNVLKTSSHSDWQKGCIAATHGRFNRIRQVAPMCTSSNMLPLAHPSPYPKRHLDRFSRFCIAQAESIYFTMGRPFPPSKLPVFMADLDPRLTRASLGPSHQHSKRQLDRFSRLCTARDSEPLYFTVISLIHHMGRPFPLIIAPSHRGSGPI